MISEFSLFVFTLLGGLAAGTYAVAAVFPGFERTDSRSWMQPVACLALLAIGGVALLVHLGHPERMLSAFANPAAGIAQEGYAVVLFGVLVVASLAYFVAKHQESPRAVSVLAGIAGLLLLCAMAFAYVTVHGIPGWSSWTTVPLFLVGGLAMGSSVVAVLPAAQENPAAGIANAVLQALFALVCVALAAVFAGVGQSAVPFAVAAVLAAIAAVVSVVAKGPGKTGLRAVSLACLFVGVAVARYAFYASCTVL